MTGLLEWWVRARPTIGRPRSVRYASVRYLVLGRNPAALDPRIDRTRQAVFQGALEVLGQLGYGAFSIEAVAAAAGVAKSTIYRHWPTKLVLVTDALETLNEQPRLHRASEAGTARERVEELITHLAEVFDDSTIARCIPALIEAAAHHREVAEFLHAYSARRRQTLVEVIQRGIDAGELSPHLDAEFAALALGGAVIYCKTMTPTPLATADARRLVTQVLGPVS